jgi:putative sigma-54 modulation protein
MSVNVEIFAKNIELTEAIKGYIEKKVSKLDRFIKEIDETRFDITYSKTARNVNERHSAQITLHGHGYILRAEERSDDLYAAIDLVMDKILRQIERYKGKKYRSFTTAKNATENIDITESEKEPVSEKPIIVRRKRFKLSPMDEMDAIEQMNMVGHEDFYIFFNLKSNRINIVYRRRDGNYGIIEPEME